MKYYKFGSKFNFKFIVRSDLPKQSILKFYTPTSFLSKVFFYFNIYKLNIVSNKEVEYFYLKKENTLLLLKCNDPKKQKFISYNENENKNKIKKWTFINSDGKHKILQEIKNIEILNNMPFVKHIEVPLILDKQIDLNNSKISFTMNEGDFLGDSSTRKLNREFLSFYFREFSSKFSFKKNNVVFTISHGDLTPWNVKNKTQGYYILDWEDLSENLLFLDIIHYQYTYYTLIKGLNQQETIRRIESLDIFKDNGENEKNYFTAINYYKEWVIEKS